MAYTKIENSDLTDIGVIGLPDRPGLSTAAMQNKLEETARSVIIPKFNNLIDEMGETDSAGNLGATPLTGRTSNPNVQAVLEKLSTDLKTVEDGMAEAIQDAHTHDNKALLDTYDQTNADIASAISDSHTHSNKSLIDSYTQTETDLADAVSKKHSHSNKALLDDYTQSDTDIADAVSKKHEHSNKSLLDDYTQTDTDLADAVSKKHEHTNLSLLETYTQTEAALAQAVTDDHTHSNKTVLDKFGESSGNPTYDGNPIGGGGSGDAYKYIVSAGETFTASGADTFKINAGSNVTITALSSPDKGIQISATGGGQSTGDMLMTDYDSQGDVKTAGGIDAYVSAQIGTLDVSDSAESGKYVSAVSETNGKITVTRASLPSVPTITDTYSGTSSDGMSGKAVKQALETLDVSDSAVSGQYVSAVSETNGKISVTRANLPTVPTSLDDLSDVTITGTPAPGQTLVANSSGIFVNQAAPASYGMIDNSDLINEMNDAITEGTSNDDVVSAYGVGTWSNVDAVQILTAVSADDDGVGTWEDEDTWETGSRTGWIIHSALHGILSDDDVEIEPIFKITGGSAVGLYAMRIDDAVTGTTGGVALKFNAPVEASGYVGIRLKHLRTNTVTV